MGLLYHAKKQKCNPIRISLISLLMFSRFPPIKNILQLSDYFNCFLKIFLICMIVCHIYLLSTFPFSWTPAYNIEITNMTNQAILLIRELLASTMDLRPWIDVFWQNSLRMPGTNMTKRKMWIMSILISKICWNSRLFYLQQIIWKRDTSERCEWF